VVSGWPLMPMRLSSHRVHMRNPKAPEGVRGGSDEDSRNGTGQSAGGGNQRSERFRVRAVRAGDGAPRSSITVCSLTGSRPRTARSKAASKTAGPRKSNSGSWITGTPTATGLTRRWPFRAIRHLISGYSGEKCGEVMKLITVTRRCEGAGLAERTRLGSAPREEAETGWQAREPFHSSDPTGPRSATHKTLEVRPARLHGPL
jgi:hypothetical protein